MARATSSQTIGPFFHDSLLVAGWNEMAPAETRGERIVIEGRVLDGDGAPVPDAMVELWQANAAGRYDHPEDQREAAIDPGVRSDFHGFGRAGTDGGGNFRFLTIKPGPVAGPGDTTQAPHISVIVFARGLLNHLYTRIYFPGEPLNATDPWLGAVPASRRHTLIAKSKPAASTRVCQFDIVLQGENETVFFDV